MPFGTPTQLTTWTADFYHLKNRCWGCVLRPQGVGAMSHWAVAMACQSLLHGACALCKLQCLLLVPVLSLGGPAKEEGRGSRCSCGKTAPARVLMRVRILLDQLPHGARPQFPDLSTGSENPGRPGGGLKEQGLHKCRAGGTLLSGVPSGAALCK